MNHEPYYNQDQGSFILKTYNQYQGTCNLVLSTGLRGIRSDKGLTLETSASKSLNGSQFTLSTQLIKPNYLVILPPTQHHSFFRNLPPSFNIKVVLFVLRTDFSLQGPVLIESLAGKCEIVKIATNPECKHFMALSREGEVYSWGSGDGGKLGHGDNK